VEGCGKSRKANRRTNASVGYVSVVLAEMESRFLRSAVAYAPTPVGMTGFFAPEPGLSFLVLSTPLYKYLYIVDECAV
jgi:hypothetical protein